MDWVSFVDQLTKVTKGVAFYCASGELSSCIMESYLSGRKAGSGRSSTTCVGITASAGR